MSTFKLDPLFAMKTYLSTDNKDHVPLHWKINVLSSRMSLNLKALFLYVSSSGMH